MKRDLVDRRSFAELEAIARAPVFPRRNRTVSEIELERCRASAFAPMPPPKGPPDEGWLAAQRIKLPARSLSEFSDARRPAATTYLHGKIGHNDAVSADRVRRFLGGVAPYQPVSITLTTNGGNAVEAFTIATLLLAHPGATTIRALADVHSAGAIILAAADTRVARAGSRFLFHLAALPDESRRLTASVLLAIGPRLARLDQKFDGYMAARLGRPISEIRALSVGNRLLDGHAAMKMGLLTVLLP